MWRTYSLNFGFSYVGLIMLSMLFIPNLLWTRNKPKDYENYASRENKTLLLLERVGQVAVTSLSLIFSDFNIRNQGVWSLWLVLAALLMILYEMFWIRYFKSEKSMKDFYSSLAGVPVAGATLPVMAFLALAIYGKNIYLGIAVILLGIGHIGIHLNHAKEIETSSLREE